MRALIVVMGLAACGESDDDCPVVPISDERNVPGIIVSGKNLIGVTWERMFDRSGFEIHAVIVSPDGTTSPDIALNELRSRGAAGTTTVLWTAGDECAEGGTTNQRFTATLQRGGEVKFVDPAMQSTSRVAIFDGQRYQMFWTTFPDGDTYHQSLDEDGTAGPVHMLAVKGMCVDAASDGAGTTFLRLDNKGYIVDTSTGMTRLAFTNTATSPRHGPTFYFAQQFHVVDRMTLFSISPSSTGASTSRNLSGDLEGAREFYPNDTTMYVNGFRGLVEVSSALTTVRDFPFETQYTLGSFGNDLVRFEAERLDETTSTPGHVDLIREGVWRKELAVDSPVRMVPSCGDIGL